MIGIVPCAGHATRMHSLPKYLLPLGDSYLLAILVRRMFAAGVRHVYIGANSENYDLVERYAPDGCTVYLVNSKTMSETVLAARKYAGDEDVLFAMPDTWWHQDDGLWRVRNVLEMTPSIATVGIFHVRPEQISKVGVCARDEEWHITRIEDKPSHQVSADMRYVWGVIAWKPPFWEYIQPTDPHVGYALSRVIEGGQTIQSEPVGDSYYDCGTPDEYFTCIRALTSAGNRVIDMSKMNLIEDEGVTR